MEPGPVDRLLDRALAALAEGDRDTANRLAGEVLAVDRNNADAEDLLAAMPHGGEIRRLSILFADLVDSTALSSRIDPETYRTVVGRYRDDVVGIVNRYEGHLDSLKGDGLLAFFGHPHAHEDDVRRAVQAGLDITREISALSSRVHRQFGFDINVRVGIHRGIVYLDTTRDDVWGLGANLAARICSLASPGTVAISDAIEPLVRDDFELEARPPAEVKGIADPVRHHRVVSERDHPRVTFGPLIGRQREYQYIGQAWAQVQSGHLTKPGVLFVGDAGIGKSRLAWSAVELAEHSHGVIVQLIGSPFHTEVGLRPIRRLLERRCGIDRSSDPALRLTRLEQELARLPLDLDSAVSALAPLLNVEPTGRYQPVRAEGRKLSELIAIAVQEYLLACAANSPTVVLVEDMHWFDAATVEVVQRLVNSDLGGHVVVVMTSRDPGAMSDVSRTQVFQLDPLTDDDANSLIVALHPSATSEEQRAVRRRCDGVPLYIEEVVAKLKAQDRGITTVDDVPDTLYEALFARLRSSTNALPVLESAALLGSRIERGTLLAVVDRPATEVDPILTQLVEAQVLEPLEADNWRFRHELLREVAAELSPPSVRRRLHHRIADVLAGAGNPDWPLIAQHYERADNFAQSAAAYSAASGDARQRGALDEARSHLTSAIAQIERSPESQDRDRAEIAFRLRRGFLIYAAEGASSPSAATEFERCLQLSSSDMAADQLLTSDELFATFCSLYGYYAMRADLDRVEQLLTSVRANLLGARQWFRPFNDAAFGMLAWYRGDCKEALLKLQSAAESRSEAGATELAAIWFMPNEATASIYTHLALAHYIQGNLNATEEELDRTERRCRSIEFPQGAFSLAYSRQLEVLIRIDAGQLARAADAAAELTKLGEQHGFDSWAMVGGAQSACVGALVAVQGAAPTAVLDTYIATITGLVDLWRMLGALSLITFYDAIVARLLIAAGRSEDARNRVELALQLADRTGMHIYDAELHRLRAHTSADPAFRAAGLRSSVELARGQGARIYELRSAIDLFELDNSTGVDDLRTAINGFSSDSGWPELALARTLLG
ncbi:MAG: AAA family ATPase [Mycolicibacterium cosmeticum]|nr:AAA family ATPase [Mycolicibacterium cosmeticum]